MAISQKAAIQRHLTHKAKHPKIIPAGITTIGEFNESALRDLLSKKSRAYEGAIEYILELRDRLYNLNKKSKRKQYQELDNCDIAVALLLQNPDWSIERIANKMGVNRTTPYKWKRFMDVFHLMKEQRKKEFYESLPQGSKNISKSRWGKEKNIEAWG